MKKLLLSIILISSFCFSQRAKVIVKNDIFKITYSEIYQQPLLVKYKVLCPTTSVSRVGMNFYTQEGIETSDNYDYVNNEYDKGHMAPVGSLNCNTDMLYKTFSYVNCALQQENLNRGVWKKLENRERVLGGLYKVSVEIRLKFTKKSIKLSTGATIPDGFYKTLKYKLNTGVIQYERYYFPNVDPVSNDLEFYRLN